MKYRIMRQLEIANGVCVRVCECESVCERERDWVDSEPRSGEKQVKRIFDKL